MCACFSMNILQLYSSIDICFLSIFHFHVSHKIYLFVPKSNEDIKKEGNKEEKKEIGQEEIKRPVKTSSFPIYENMEGTVRNSSARELWD